MTSRPAIFGLLTHLRFRVRGPKSIMGKLHFIIILALSVGIAAILATPLSAFEYDGTHWYDSDLPVTWEMNQNGTADCTGEFDAVRAGYQTWENVSGSYFTETYMGTTSLTGPTLDGHNVVLWGSTGGSIATCYYWYYPSTGRLVEFDIVFEDDFTWSSTGEAGEYDVQNIATHELGHTLVLGDLYGAGDTEKTMYGYGSLGETKKRSLHQDDIDGIRYIYPESGNRPPNTPSSPSGPDAGTHGPSYSFTTSTTDPDGDQVAFKFSWGDGTKSGWTSFVGSGGSASMSHSWSSQGTYAVRAKAKDVNGAESGWSSSHEIVIRAILLEVDPSSLDFGELGRGSSGTMTFRAYNVGAGTLSGNLGVDRDWIAVSPSSFEGNDNTISVTVETEGLAESLTPHTGTITATSNGGTKTVEIIVIVIPSRVVAYPNPFSFAGHVSLTFWGALVPYARIQIFTTAGDLVRTLVETAGVSKLSWDGRNEEGDRVARGIYIYVAKDSRGKIAVL